MTKGGNTVDLFGAAGAKKTLDLMEEARVGVLRQAEEAQGKLAETMTHTAQVGQKALDLGNDAVERAQQAGVEAMQAAMVLPRFVTADLSDPPVPTAEDLAANSVILGSRLSEAVPGATQMLLWDRISNKWTIRGAPTATGPEVARQKDELRALQHGTLEAMLASTSPAPRHSALGRRGGLFELLPADFPDVSHDDGAEGLYHQRQDGRMLRRIVGRWEMINAAWWPIQFGPVTDPALSDEENAQRLMDEQQRFGTFLSYVQKHGGQFEMPYGMELHAMFDVHELQQDTTIYARGFSVKGPDRLRPAVVFNGFKKLTIVGMSANHPFVGDAPPVNHLDPRRSTGGHGFHFYNGDYLSTSHLYADRVASMGIVTGRVRVFQHVSPVVNIAMGDGVHTYGGCEQGTITSPLVRYCGDDGIPVVSYIPKPGEDMGDMKGLCRNITITGGNVQYAGARGLCVAGGDNIVYSGVLVDSTWSFGAVVHQDNGFETYPSTNININGGIIANAGRYGKDAVPSPGVYVSQGCTNVSIGGGLQVYGGTSHGMELHGTEITVGHVDVHHNDRCGFWVTGDNVTISADAVARNNKETGLRPMRRPKLLVRKVEAKNLEGQTVIRAEEYQATDEKGNPIWLLPQNLTFAGTLRANAIGVASYPGVIVSLRGAFVVEHTGFGLDCSGEGIIRMTGGCLEHNEQNAVARTGGKIYLNGTDVEEATGYGLQAFDAGSRIEMTGGSLRRNGTTPGAVNVQAIAHHGGIIRALAVNAKTTLTTGSFGAHDGGVLKLLACDLDEAGTGNPVVDFGNAPKITVKGCLGTADTIAA